MDLAQNHIHIYHSKIDPNFFNKYDYLAVLSKTEIERAGRFRFDIDRNRFIYSHCFLKTILARYLNVAPSQVTFIYNQYGKPYLAESFQKSNLQFNISHSKERVLMGLRTGEEIGVDLEWIQPDFVTNEVAEYHFAPGEVFKFKNVAEKDRVRTFFSIWTRKEAFIKAVGKGVSFGLEKFEVSIDPDQPAQLLGVEDGLERIENWQLKSLDIDENYPVAFATVKPVSKVEVLAFRL